MMDYTDEFSFILKQSTIQNAGIGVFATHPINPATLIRVAPKYIRSRRLKSRQIPDAFKTYCIIEDDETYRAPLRFNRMEIGWFINHSFTPNIEKRDGNFYALRAIAAGEEIVIDYNQFNEPEALKEGYYKIIQG